MHCESSRETLRVGEHQPNLVGSKHLTFYHVLNSIPDQKSHAFLSF